MTENALAVQVGGSHYQNKAIQPVEFGMANQLDCCAFSILKYTSRHREKNGRQDLLKAEHFVDLRLATCSPSGTLFAGLFGRKPALPRLKRWVITPQEYCEANNLPLADRAVISMLGVWLQTGEPFHARLLKVAIRGIIDTTYSTQE